MFIIGVKMPIISQQDICIPINRYTADLQAFIEMPTLSVSPCKQKL